MAEGGNQSYGEKFCCSICLDLLKDPVTPVCGHSYCSGCLKGHWDSEQVRGIYSCPQCRQTFAPRPELKTNILVAELVEELKKTGLQAAPADPCSAGPEDVACDFCTGRKVKALKSCLSCLASYCENHLQPHFNAAPFMKHKLVEPCEKLQENICPRHDEVMKLFCRTDRQCICYLCSVDQHKGHDTVSAAAERAERQEELEGTRLNIQQRVRDAEGDVKLLQREAEAIRASADGAADQCDEIFAEMIRELQGRSAEVKWQIQSEQETEERRVKELQEELEREVAELKRRDAELEQLAHTQDHRKFLQDYASLSTLGPLTHPSGTRTRPPRYFGILTAAVSQVRGQIQDVLTGARANFSRANVDVLPQKALPESRADFLKYSVEIMLDPNTASKLLLLSNGNRKVTSDGKKLSYSDHPDRFTYRPQVLSRESLTGRCYWEVEGVTEGGGIGVAVSYKNIRRDGFSWDCEFGMNDKSWSLACSKKGYWFWHNNIKTTLSGPGSSRVGVYLDLTAGVLSFYSVSDTMTLIHRVQTTFTQPLHAGIETGLNSSAEFCSLK